MIAAGDDRQVIRYLPVDGFPGYEIGSDGTYRSQKAAPGRPRLRGDQWHVMKGHDNGQGYLVANLYRDGRRHVRYVHRLVLEAFVGPCPDGMEACHDPDRDTTNNRLDNLRWDTRKENHRDKAVHGTLLRGSGIVGSKLDENAVIDIRRLCDRGVCQREIAEMYGVGQTLVSLIKHRKVWQHVG